MDACKYLWIGDIQCEPQLHDKQSVSCLDAVGLQCQLSSVASFLNWFALELKLVLIHPLPHLVLKQAHQLGNGVILKIIIISKAAYEAL